MIRVLKIGGAALDDPLMLLSCVHAIQSLTKSGQRLAVVHGGGIVLTRTLERLGKTSEFKNGLRVTDAETRDVALMVLAGLLNKQLVAALIQSGVAAIGLSGGDGPTFRAKKVSGPDLGFVGEIDQVDMRWINAIWNAGGVPVMSSMALGPNGDYYNVNADQMAVACAVACQANELIFLTEVDGVLDAQRQVISRLNSDDIAALIATNVIKGGMLPKMAACQMALQSGVERVRVFPAAKAARVTAGASHTWGTEVVRI